MKLLIDAGNSRLKWAWLEHGALRDPGAAPRAGGELADVLPSPKASGRRPGEIVIASVLTPGLTKSLATHLAETFAAPVRLAETEPEALGVRNGYLDYRQMGVDRWLAILATYVTYRRAACVVDAGTALTIDGVAADGSHRGGLIVPGPALMRRSLLQDTAGIRPAAERLVDTTTRPAAAWGRDTDSCIRLGSLRATACLVEDCMKAWRRLEGSGAVLVLTGGDAAALGDALSLPVEHRPHLVLEGLALRYGGD